MNNSRLQPTRTGSSGSRVFSPHPSIQLLLGQNLSSIFTVGNAYWWNGVIVAASTIPNNTDYYSDNVILDNYNYGMLFFYNASNADLYNNVICNNSKSGLNLSQISINTESIVNANESAPYNNTYCANNPYWIEYSKVLQLVISPADAITTVVGYTTNSTRSPIQVNPGLAVYLLPAVSYYNGTSLIETPYLWTVSKPGYATRQGLASMTTDETIIVNLLSGFNPTIVCPINSTTQMCQLMSESGAGLGSFIEYLGGPLMLLLLVLVIVGMIGAIGFSIVAVIKERMK